MSTLTIGTHERKLRVCRRRAHTAASFQRRGSTGSAPPSASAPPQPRVASVGIPVSGHTSRVPTVPNG